PDGADGTDEGIERAEGRVVDGGRSQRVAQVGEGEVAVLERGGRLQGSASRQRLRQVGFADQLNLPRACGRLYIKVAESREGGRHLEVGIPAHFQRSEAGNRRRVGQHKPEGGL